MADGAVATIEPVIPEELLPACAVRIQVGAAHAGSGFFAAPGVVVTCHHVLAPLELPSGTTALDASVIDVNGNRFGVLDVADDSPADDIAVLRVEAGGGHPSALLATGLRTGDEVKTFGYPERHPEGVPTILRAEGLSGGERPMMKLAGGQVQPGMSGSPVLSLRTGAVCGILKSTRDRTQALGAMRSRFRRCFGSAPRWSGRTSASTTSSPRGSTRCRESSGTFCGRPGAAVRRRHRPRAYSWSQ
ncbi:MAG TPA: serine protease [Solirubrobacteraceae bacterium]|nr:serine protease [Solirubrobacteraceae bacterium]